MGQRSEQYFQRAQNSIPGGVNSPVRAFKSVGSSPLFIESAKGAYLHDVDGNSYVDMIGSWGPMLFGHAHPFIEDRLRQALPKSFSYGAPTYNEILLAEKIIAMVPSIDMVRLVNSGTEATMAAIRLARAFTSRDKILKFEGCYHGHGDSFLIAAGSGAATLGHPDSPGVTKHTAADTLTAAYNALEEVKACFEAYPDGIAAVILEPVVGNMGLVPPNPGFLEGLRQLCDRYGSLLIFDEVMTGFRLSAAGYQGLTDVRPDLCTLGKIIGGGLPVGAYGGRKDIMQMVAPSGPMYQAGTLSGNPLATTAGLAMMALIEEHPQVYQNLDQYSAQIADGLSEICASAGVAHVVQRVGSMFTLFFNEGKIENFASAKASDLNRFAAFFRGMLAEGIYLPPSQFEAAFVSAAHGPFELDQILTAARKAIKQI